MIGRRRTEFGTRAEGSETRFRALMLPHLDAAYNLARYLSGDSATAEDITQETFLRAFKAFDSYRDGSPRAWLLAILRNIWRDRAAEDARRGRIIISEVQLTETQVAAVSRRADDADTPDALLEGQSETERVRAAIAELPEPFRETLVLREFEAFSYREIAQSTGVPMGTVMSRLARAREMLGAALLPPAQQPAERGEEQA